MAKSLIDGKVLMSKALLGKVLIVDDDREIVLAQAELMRRQGLTPLMASDGDSALDCVRREHPDLLLVDFHMPGKNGLEVMQKAQALDEDLLVILITGFAEVRSAVEAILAGAHGYLAMREHVLQLPRFSAQLVELSKNLKQFRKLLTDSARAILYAVSTPTRMAWEETKDLLAACDRLGIVVPAIFLNLMTPPAECDLCASLRRRESATVKSFRQAFPKQQLSLVDRQGQPVGLERLEELALSLYETTSLELASSYARA